MQCGNCGLVSPLHHGNCARCGAWLTAPNLAAARPAPPGQFHPSGPQLRPPRPDHRRPANAGVLVGVTLWRLVIVGFALTGLFAAIEKSSDAGSALRALSQQASLLAAVVYGLLCLYPLFTGLRFHEPKSPWLRGATTVTLLLVASVFLTMLSGDVSETWSLFEHLLTPLIVLVDYLVVGRNQGNARGWTPVTWLAFPLAYLFYYNAAELEIYESDFTLRFDNSDFMSYFPGFVAGLLFAGYVLWAVGKVKAAASASIAAQNAMAAQNVPPPHASPAGPPPQPGWQQQPNPPGPRNFYNY